MNIFEKIFRSFNNSYKTSESVQTGNGKATDLMTTDLDDEMLIPNVKYLAVKDIYSKYFKAVEKAEARSKPTDGLFGLGSSLKNSPCHEDFYDELSVKLDSFICSGLSEQEACIITAYILRSPAEHRKNSTVFPMLFAATGLAAKLADKLTPADAGRLADEFCKIFPKHERMPAQKNTLRALYEQAKSG